MQEIKHLMLRVSAVANEAEFVFDGSMADAHIQGYLNQGFRVHTSHPGSVTPNYVSVFYVLLRETQPDMDVPKAQEQINQMVEVDKESKAAFEDVVEGISRGPGGIGKWQQTEVPA